MSPTEVLPQNDRIALLFVNSYLRMRLESLISELRINAEPDIIINSEKSGFAEIISR